MAETPLRAVVIEPPPPDLRSVVAAAIGATPDDWLDSLAHSLSLPTPAGIEALRRLGAHRPHYSADDIGCLSPRDPFAMHSLRRQCDRLRRGQWAAFPMVVRDRVVGVRMRETPTATKRALLRGREGLFVPAGLTVGAELLVICEGQTDCAALLSIGIEAIGRPSCTGSVPETVRLMLTVRPRVVALLLDRDSPGMHGGVTLARALTDVADDVRCALPPAGTKDARAWVAAGATRDDLLATIDGGRRV